MIRPALHLKHHHRRPGSGDPGRRLLNTSATVRKRCNFVISKKIILDCDPGMDDSMAIVMAAKAPQLELLAVTAVNGNYPVDVT